MGHMIHVINGVCCYNFEHIFIHFFQIPGVNIIGIFPGTGGNDSVDTIYMVGAYYDTKQKERKGKELINPV